MSEQLGGSRKGNQGGGMLGSMMSTNRRDAGGAMGATNKGMGGTSARPGSARGGLAGAMGMTSSPARPGSARAMGATTNSPGDARARVEESRQAKEAQFWGRTAPIQRDLPAYWSVATYGQPFNDERLAMGGATNHYQILNPSSYKDKDKPNEVVGPATEQQAVLRKSLVEGKRLYNKSTLGPLAPNEMEKDLDEQDRIFLLNRLTPYQRIHALRNCLDRNMRDDGDAKPWTEMVDEKLDKKFWLRNKEMAIRTAVLRLENLMRRHLDYLSEKRCYSAHAPSSRPKDVLREELWRVDPDRTGLVALDQFLQVWQNRLCLLEYSDEHVMGTNGKPRVVLKPGKRFILDESMAAALFCKYGFDKDGLLPYAVYIQALTASASRVLGQELVIDQKARGKNGLFDEIDIGYCMGGAKILYRHCETGVIPPSQFDPRTADRSQKIPTAHMWLEHVYGYAGHDINQSNIFYTCNTDPKTCEIAYYTGAVGVVMNKNLWEQKKPSQRFFFGHSNDIECMTMHPNRRFAATGQQKQTGPDEVPYVCIWDVNTCNMLQRLNHAKEERAVIALCFSGNVNAPSDSDKVGGDILVTVTADSKHTVHVWKWMTNENKFARAVYIPGFYYGPSKKLESLKNAEPYPYFYDNPEKFEKDKPIPKDPSKLRSEKYSRKDWAQSVSPDDAVKEIEDPNKKSEFEDHPLLKPILNNDIRVNPDWEWGHCCDIPKGSAMVGSDGNYVSADKTAEMIEVGPGCNGTPPMVFGIAWNPLRPADGRRGSEFATYGVKHLKTWIVDDTGKWLGVSASFGSGGVDHIENVLSCCYVPALHAMASPGDSCILTGFASGQIGLWIPPYPTRAGATYQLTSKFEAHSPGIKVPMQDGTITYGGVKVIKLRGDPEGGTSGRTIVTGGADGHVMQWELVPVTGARKDGTPLKGVGLRFNGSAEEKTGPNRFRLECPNAPYDPKKPAMVVSLDCHPSRPTEMMVGTSDCDIWDIENDPLKPAQIFIEGQEEDMWRLATHPAKPNILASTCESGRVRVWDSNNFDVLCSASVGFPITGIAYSNEMYGCSTYKDKQKKNYHIAVGSKGKYELGDWHKVAVMDADDLRPLKILKEPTAQVTELKYSPDTKGVGLGGYLAAGSQDMHIYIYSCTYDYQLISKCTGHSGCVMHIDWTLPISVPGTKLNGTMIIKAVDESKNLLYWDPKTGKKVMQNQRDAPMDTDTSRVGFNVMGIWPDASSFDDINSVCASARGSPWFDPVVSVEGRSVDLREVAKNLAEQKGSRLSVQGEAEFSNMADLLALKAVKAESEGMSSEYFGADGVPGGGYLVTADDYSTIKLFNYPVVWDDAPYKAFRGHASFIQCVRFNCDDGLVFSAGGHDRGIYQWRTIGMSLPDGVKGETPGKTLSEDDKKKLVVDKILLDKKILKIRHRLIENRRDNNLSDQPTPGVEWGPVDGTGKVFGPRVADSSKRQDQEYARMEELRASGSLLVNKKEEATITPGKQTMLNRR